MAKTQYTSIYLPINLKSKLVKTAEAEGYSVRRGRQSQLAKFIQSLLHEREFTTPGSPEKSPFHSLNPDLRSAVFKLSELDDLQQQCAGSILEVLLKTWSNSSQ